MYLDLSFQKTPEPATADALPLPGHAPSQNTCRRDEEVDFTDEVAGGSILLFLVGDPWVDVELLAAGADWPT